MIAPFTEAWGAGSLVFLDSLPGYYVSAGWAWFRPLISARSGDEIQEPHNFFPVLPSAVTDGLPDGQMLSPEGCLLRAWLIRQMNREGSEGQSGAYLL